MVKTSVTKLGISMQIEVCQALNTQVSGSKSLMLLSINISSRIFIEESISKTLELPHANEGIGKAKRALRGVSFSRYHHPLPCYHRESSSKSGRGQSHIHCYTLQAYIHKVFLVPKLYYLISSGGARISKPECPSSSLNEDSAKHPIILNQATRIAERKEAPI